MISLYIVMDRQVIAGLKLTADCSKHLNDAQVAATAAMKAATSASTFHAEGEVDLSISRINRTEKLLVSLRKSLGLFNFHFDLFYRRIFDVTKLRNRHMATWNTLSDEWWHERARSIVGLLSFVKVAQSRVSSVLDIGTVAHDPTEPSYEQVTTAIKDAVNGMKGAWDSMETFINEWKDIAVTVFEGIGESGSLIPT